MSERILQIIPATEKVYAVYQGDPQKGDPERIKCRIQMWALMEDKEDGYRHVAGMDLGCDGMHPVEDAHNFLHYEWEGENFECE